jgi:hypothetical protein
MSWHGPSPALIALVTQACHPASSREVFERARRCVVASDANGFADLFATEGFMEFPFGGAVVELPACLEGRETIRRHIATALARSRESGRRLLGYDAIELHETTDPEVIIVEFDLEGEVTRTGQTYQVPTCRCCAFATARSCRCATTSRPSASPPS